MAYTSKSSWTAFARYLALTASIALCSAPAGAQSSRDGLTLARGHMERGQALYLQSRNLEAAAEFLAGYEVRTFAAFLYNAGIAYERHGDAGRAIELYRRYVRQAEGASDRAEVEGRIGSLERQLGIARHTNPDGTNPDGTNPDGTNPDGTNPDGTNPDGTNPDGTNPDGTNPDGTNPDGTNPDGTNPDGTNPDGTNPNGTNPDVLVAAGPERAMKSLLSVETNPSGAQVSLRQHGEVVTSGPSPFNETLDEGTYLVSVEHPDFQTITHTMVISAGKVYVAVLEMSQGNFAGLLRVVTDPPGASVYVDDHDAGALGQTPFQNVVPVGPHRVWVERPGYETIEQEIEVDLGDQAEMTLELERVSYGRLRITANFRGAEVFIDGELQGTVPFEGQVDAGPHNLVVSADGMKSFDEAITIERGQLTPITVELKPSVSRSGAWVTAVMGALAIGGGTALYLISQNNLDELRADTMAGTLVADDDRIFRGRVFTVGSYAAFGVGTLLGVLSIYYFLRDGTPDSEGSVLEPRDWLVTPTASREQTGLMLQGSF